MGVNVKEREARESRVKGGKSKVNGIELGRSNPRPRSNPNPKPHPHPNPNLKSHQAGGYRCAERAAGAVERDLGLVRLGVEGDGLVARVVARHVALAAVDAQLVVDQRHRLLLRGGRVRD